MATTPVTQSLAVHAVDSAFYTSHTHTKCVQGDAEIPSHRTFRKMRHTRGGGFFNDFLSTILLFSMMMKEFYKEVGKNARNKLTHYPPATWKSPSHLYQWISAARQFTSAAMCPSTLELIWVQHGVCGRLLQAAKMCCIIVSDIISVKMLICI